MADGAGRLTGVQVDEQFLARLDELQSAPLDELAAQLDEWVGEMANDDDIDDDNIRAATAEEIKAQQQYVKDLEKQTNETKYAATRKYLADLAAQVEATKKKK